MGGTVSTGEDNDDLVDNLMDQACITSPEVEHVFRAVDRAFYYTEDSKHSAYKDTAWRSDNLHLSAPCIYSSVLENLSLARGQSFLNIGSGTGYVSTMVGLIIGSGGVNHGVEVFHDVVEYARERLHEFQTTSSAVDQFDFCPPQFVWGNGLLLNGGRQYDRVYCGARCPSAQLPHLKHLLKQGGVLVVPINDHLKRIERRPDGQWDVQNKLSVSFAPLIEPRAGDGRHHEPALPALAPGSLQHLCRVRIRQLLRELILQQRPDLAGPGRPASCEPARRRPPPQPRRGSRQARRIQRLVLPMLNDLEPGPDDEQQDEQEEAEEGRQRRQLRHFGEVLYGAVTRMAREGWGHVSDRVDGDASEQDSGDSDSDSELDDDADGHEDPPPAAERGRANSGSPPTRYWPIRVRREPDVPTVGAVGGGADVDGSAAAAPAVQSTLDAPEGAAAAQPAPNSADERLEAAISATADDGRRDELEDDPAPTPAAADRPEQRPAAADTQRAASDAAVAVDRSALKRTGEAAAGGASGAQKRGRPDQPDSQRAGADAGAAATAAEVDDQPHSQRTHADDTDAAATTAETDERTQAVVVGEGSAATDMAETGEQVRPAAADRPEGGAAVADSPVRPAAADRPEGGAADGAASSQSSETEERGHRPPSSFVIGLPRRLGRPDSAPSDDDDDDDDGYPTAAARRRRRRSRPATQARARDFSEQLRQRVAQLPLPPQLRLYVNLDRPV